MGCYCVGKTCDVGPMCPPVVRARARELGVPPFAAGEPDAPRRHLQYTVRPGPFLALASGAPPATDEPTSQPSIAPSTSPSVLPSGTVRISDGGPELQPDRQPHGVSLVEPDGLAQQQPDGSPELQPDRQPQRGPFDIPYPTAWHGRADAGISHII